MPRFVAMILLAACAVLPAFGQSTQPASSDHYLFAWTGDAAKKGNDFLAVIDADPASPSYGHLMTTLVTDQQTKRVHHTEYTMPASGMLFANDHEAGRTFIFDVHDSLHPAIAASFTDMAGYMHPHSYLRLPNGHVLATFQHSHDSMDPESLGRHGGLVEIDDAGKVIRSASAADPAFPDALLTPYSLVVLPELDRVVSTNSAMDQEDLFRGLTYQIWRLSDLKLLKTMYFDPGIDHYAQISPEEPRLAPDGSVFVQTLACGIERITGIATDSPKSELVYSLPTSFCGVPTIVGHYLIVSILYDHVVVVLDIANEAKPVEVSRVKLGDDYLPHWTGWDAKTNRIVVTGGGRLYLLKFDPATGALSIDESFHDSDGKAGFNFLNREWPHGWKGSGVPHGVVFSR
ncbi:MAG: hypothetical protein WAM78_07620 [Candidatus Sulfotelmatobacter sp.]